jgi:hypothetical protein
LENLVPINPLVVANPDGGRIDIRNASAFTKTDKVQVHHQGNEHACLQLYKAIVGNRIGKVPIKMLFDKEKIVMLEISVRSEVKANQDGYDLTGCHLGCPVACFHLFRGTNRFFLDFQLIFFVKIVSNTEYFYNFVRCNHRGLFC